MMNDVVQQLLDRMRASERQELLMLLAASIHAMTIVGRMHYDDEDSANHLRQTNESIHRLVGHLWDLCDPNEAFTESRAGAVWHLLAVLPSSFVVHICGLKA